jgi:tetratricopeptide (TPR) repeat protein
MRPTRIAGALALLLASSTAHAQRAGDEAARHYAAGRAALLEHRDDEAAREFLAAYEISHDPSNLFNLGIVYEDARRWSDALDSYRRFLAAAPDAPNRGDVERRIRVLEATVSASQTPATATTPTAAPTETLPPPPTPLPLAPLLVAGGGVVFVAVGAGFGGVALTTRSGLQQSCGNVMQCPDTPSNRTAARNLTIDSALSDVFLGVGAAAVIGGGVWFLLARSHANEQRARATLMLSPTSIGIAGTF